MVVAESVEQTVRQVPVSEIKPAKDNPRSTVGDVAELAASISELGIRVPLLLRPVNGHFEIVAGERRFTAAKLAGLDAVPAIVDDQLADDERTLVMAIENLAREDLTVIDEARVYRRLLDELGVTQRELAAKVGRSQPHISKRLSLLELPKKLHGELDSGGITLEDAQELLKLKDDTTRIDSALKWVKSGHTVEHAVDREIRARELTLAIAAASEQIKTDGVKQVFYKKTTWGGFELPAGVKKVSTGGEYGRDVKMAPAAHAKLPCHAAAINPKSGEIVYLCTKPASHDASRKKPAGEQTQAEKNAAAAAAEERAKERAKAIRARDRNVELGRRLDETFAAPKLDMATVQLLVDLLMSQHDFGADLAYSGLRFTDEASHEIVRRKDQTISRIVHAPDRHHAKTILEKRLAAAKTPEQLVGVLLQALVAAKLADTHAVPVSARWSHVTGLGAHSHRGRRIATTLDKLAAKIKPAPAKAAA